jgi:hypothetical protein
MGGVLWSSTCVENKSARTILLTELPEVSLPLCTHPDDIWQIHSSVCLEEKSDILSNADKH